MWHFIHSAFVEVAVPISEAAVGVAIAGLILATATVLIGLFITGLLGHLPVVGGWIQSHLHAFFSEALSGIWSWIMDLWRIMAWLIKWCMSWLNWTFRTVSTLWTHFWSEIDYLYHHTVPWLQWYAANQAWKAWSAATNYAWQVGQWATSYAHSLWLDNHNYATWLYNQAEHYAWEIGQWATGYAWQLWNNARYYAWSLSQADRAYSLDLYKSATYYAWEVYQSATRYAHDLDQTELERAKQLFQQAEQHADAVAAADVAQALQGLDATIRSIMEITISPALEFAQEIEGTWAQDFPEVAALLQKVPQEIPQDLPAAVLAISGLIPPILRTVDDCVLPNCKDLGPNRQFNHSLFSGLIDAALLALLYEMIHHPEQAARDINDVMGPVAGGAIDLTKTLFQVA